ncbi:MAG: hypothetical protein U0324_14240 [Polyangiales bacterium]
MTPRGAALALALALLARTGAATACDARDRDAAIAEANRLRAAGSPDAALGALRDLWGRCPEPRVLVQMALAEHSAGRWLDAWRHMNESLATRDDPWVDARRAVIERARDVCREHLAALSVTADAAGATLSLDGGDPMLLPLDEALVVAAGDHALAVAAPNRRPTRRTVTLTEGASLDERFTLAPDAPPAPLPTPPVAEVTPTPPADAPPVVDDARPRGGALRYVGIAVAALGAAAVGFGVYQWAATSSLGDALAGASYDGAEPYASARLYLDRTGAANYCDRASAERATNPAAAQASSLCDQHAQAQAMALAFGLGGVALAGAGAAMIVLGGPRRATSSRVTVAPWVAPGAGGATAVAHF